MKRLLALIATVLLGGGTAACGNSGEGKAARDPSSAATLAGSTASVDTASRKKDRDNDEDNNDDDQHVLGFGRPADPADYRAISSLVRAYYAAAAKANGRKACALLTPFVAESVVEADGQSPALHGHSCAEVISKMFKLRRRELASKSATLRFMRVGVEGDRSLVALEFPRIPEARQITARRVGRRWTILDLLDGIFE